MKILYCTPRPFGLVFGGSEVQLMKTKEAVEDLGHQVVLANYFDHDLIKGVDVVHLFGSDYVFGQWADLVSGHGVPLVVSSIFYPVGTGRYKQALAARLPKNVVSIRRAIMMKADKVLPNSESEARVLRQWFAIPADKLAVTPNGVDENFVGREPEQFRRKYLGDLPMSEPFILSVGRIESRKNTLRLVQAASRLKLPLVLVGRYVTNEPSYCADVRSAISSSSTYIRHIEFLPPGSDDLANAYAAAHTHALVSLLETPGLASLEAALNGANVVLGDCEPVQEYFREYGFIANPRDDQDISRALRQAMTHPRNYANQKDIVANRYTWKNVGALTVKAYEQVLKGV